MNWTFDQIDMATASPGDRLCAIFERSRYRWHIRKGKISPGSKRWWRRQRRK